MRASKREPALTARITELEVKPNASAETPANSTPLSRTVRSGTVPTEMFGSTINEDAIG
jgi:hypothetical protein